MYMLDDGGAWSTGCTRVAVFIGHEGVARVVYQNKPRVCNRSRPQARNRLTNLYDDASSVQPDCALLGTEGESIAFSQEKVEGADG